MDMSKTVILIDDDQDHLDLLKLTIKQIDSSISCISFIYADDAIKSLENFSKLPSCIFIDFNLPRKEGIECLYEIRRVEKYRSMKVIMYAKNAPDVIIEALKEAGADEVFEKPSKLSAYKELISKFVS